MFWLDEGLGTSGLYIDGELRQLEVVMYCYMCLFAGIVTLIDAKYGLQVIV